jgi:hypothetical protein
MKRKLNMYLKFSKRDTNKEDLNCPNLSIEQVHHYRYLGSIINDNNSIEEKRLKRG